MPKSPLKTAATALDAGRPAEALDALLGAWDSRPLAATAGCIERLSALCNAALPGIAERKRKAIEAAWVDLEGKGRAVDVGHLLPNLFLPPSKVIKARIQRLLLRPRDPRLTPTLTEFVAERDYTSTGARPLWTQVFKLLRQQADPASRPSLEAFDAVLRAELDAHTLAWPLDFEEYLHNQVQKVLAKVPDAPSPTAEEEAQLKEVEACLEALESGPPPTAEWLAGAEGATSDPGQGADLLALVLERPDDVAALAVYTDWLLEQGDPRGDLIQLQQLPKRRAKDDKRIKALLKAHRVEWLGPIEAVLDHKSCVFERGFLAAGVATFKTKKQRKLLSDPGWRTVRALETADAQVLLSPNMVSLRQIGVKRLAAGGSPEGGRRFTSPGEGIPLGVFSDVLKHGTALPFQTACVHLPSGAEAAECGKAFEGDALPHLVDLHVAYEYSDYGAMHLLGARPDSLQWLFDSALAPQLQRFGLHRYWTSFPSLLEWLTALTDASPKLLEFSMDEMMRSRFDYQLHRPADAVGQHDAWTLTVRVRSTKILETSHSSYYTEEQERSDVKRWLQEQTNGLGPYLRGVVVDTPKGRLVQDHLDLLESALKELGPVTLPAAKKVRGT